MSDEPPSWDPQKAAALIGSKVLIGLTFVSDAGEEQVQMHGVVTEATPESGIEIALEGNRAGDTYRLPPDLRGFFPAPPGEYRLRSTGEVVIDPDFTANWTISRPH